MATPVITPQLWAQARALTAPRPTFAPMSSMAAMPDLGTPASTNNVIGAPTQAQQNLAARNDLLQQGDGISHISNPYLRGFARVGDVALHAIAPNIEQYIPGTIGNHAHELAKANAQIAVDQHEAINTAALQDQQAQARQRDALATQEQAKAEALTNPKPSDGELLYDKAGTPIGFRDGEGNYHGPQDEALPQGIRDVLGAAKAKAPTNALELWQQQHPNEDVSGFVKLEHPDEARPLEVQLADAEQAGDANRVSALKRAIHESRVEPKIEIHQGTATSSGGGAAPQVGNDALTGDQYLSSLPTGLQQIIKSTAAGDIAAPPPGTRNKEAQAIRQAVLNYDPTYTDARYKAKQQFKTGGDAQNVQRLGTAILHANNALTNSAKMGFAPAFGTPLQDAGDAAYRTDADFLAGELGQFVTGGKLTVDEGHKLEKNLYSSRQSVRDSAINEMLSLAGGKLESKMQGYKTATGLDFPSEQYFDPHTHNLLRQHGIIQGGAPQVGTQRFTVNGTVYNIPADQVAEFKKDNPNAR